MILGYPQMETVMEFGGSKIPTLVIESPIFLRRFVMDLYGQIQGQEGELVLSDDGKTLPISGWVEVIENCLTFQLNTKALLSKVNAALEKTAVSEGFFLKTAELLQKLESYMGELAFAFDCDIVCQHCTPAGVIKAISPHLRDEYDDPLERLIDYMELVREFDRDKLFVLLHLRSYFDDGQISVFLQTALAHGYRILLVDTADRGKLREESRVTIDKDMCEF